MAIRSAHHDDEALVLVNGFWEQVAFTLPLSFADHVVETLCTFDPARHSSTHRPGDTVEVPPRSILVLLAAPRENSELRQPQ